MNDSEINLRTHFKKKCFLENFKYIWLFLSNKFKLLHKITMLKMLKCIMQTSFQNILACPVQKVITEPKALRCMYSFTYYILIWKAQGQEERQIFHTMYDSFPKILPQLELILAKARSLEFCLGLQQGWRDASASASFRCFQHAYEEDSIIRTGLRAYARHSDTASQNPKLLLSPCSKCLTKWSFRGEMCVLSRHWKMSLIFESLYTSVRP